MNSETKLPMLLRARHGISIAFIVVAGFFWAFPRLPASGAEDGIDHYLYVNQAHPQASDKNPGSLPLPLKTINRAVAVALTYKDSGFGTKITIQPGTYRESIEIQGRGTGTKAPLIFEAQGQVIISGADIWDDWQPEPDGTYTHNWPYKWGLAAVPEGWEPHVTLQAIVRRREMIIVNGSPLTQVLNREQLQAGCFYVDEATETVSLRFSEATDPETAVVEVAVRAPLFRASKQAHLVLRGITFQYDNSGVDDRAVLFIDVSNILVEGCRFRWNNWNGLGFSLASHVTARNNVAKFNGATGITTWRTKQVVFEDNQTSYNNRRGIIGDFTGWSLAGIKILHMHGAVIKRHQASNNDAHGIWFDTDCKNITVDDSSFNDNLRYGIYVEANQGPIQIRNSKICRNRDLGIQIANSAGLTLEHNIIYGNANLQINVTGLYDRPRKETNWETRLPLSLLTEKGTWTNNVIIGLDKNQLLVGTTLAPALWDRFLRTLTSNRNLWFNAQNPRVFQLAGGTMVDFRAWLLTSGQDYTSVFADPRFKDPAKGDFDLLSDSPFHLIPDSNRSKSKSKIKRDQ